MFALYRAQRFLEEKGADDISLIITGGLRVSSDFAKALALGADAIAIESLQYCICGTGKCPKGITTQDPELRKRLDVDEAAKGLENYMRASTKNWMI